MPQMRSRCLVAQPFDAVPAWRVVELVTGFRLRTIDERPICLTVGQKRHPVAWVVSYAWAMHAEQAIHHCEVMGWE